MTIHTPLCDLLGIEHPIMLAGMGGVSYAEVVAAVSNAGGFGTLGMAGLKVSEIEAQVKKTKDLTDKPFGLDLLAALPETLERTVDLIIDYKIDAFISGLGVPFNIKDKLQSAGVKVMNVCGKVDHAIKGAEAGLDAVIVQGTEGGGHTGKVAGMALLPQAAAAVDIPVIGAGSIIDGRGLAAALAFGCQGVWVGTRFIASKEAHAGALYQDSITQAKDSDTVVTRSYSGKTMRVRRNAYTDDWESRPQDIQPFPQQASDATRAGVMGGISGQLDGLDPDRSCFPMGQGAGGITAVKSCAEIIDEMVAEAQAVISRLSSMQQNAVA
ncbi:MAG: nitronate monooxygenase family protein [Pseudomonadota bacterium]